VAAGSEPKAGWAGWAGRAGWSANVAAGSEPYAGRLCRVLGGMAVGMVERPPGDGMRLGSSVVDWPRCSSNAAGSAGRAAGMATMPAGGSEAAGCAGADSFAAVPKKLDRPGTTRSGVAPRPLAASWAPATSGNRAS
jgi:hypothetical protein